MNEKLLTEVQTYVEQIFRAKTPPENIYHNLEHTFEVITAVKEIALAERISDDDLELLLIAAWFHDSGCVKMCKGHEALSAQYAESFLKSVDYPVDKIKQIISLIIATRVPQAPQNHLEEILCDADLLHLGTKDFKERGDLLRCELERRGDATFTDEQWLEFSIKFINMHHFFTIYCKDKYETQKNINLNTLKNKLIKVKDR